MRNVNEKAIVVFHLDTKIICITRQGEADIKSFIQMFLLSLTHQTLNVSGGCSCSNFTPSVSRWVVECRRSQ